MLGEPVAGIDLGVFALVFLTVVFVLPAATETVVGESFCPAVRVGDGVRVGETFACCPKPWKLFLTLNRPVITAKKTITTTRPRTNETILLKLSMIMKYIISL